MRTSGRDEIRHGWDGTIKWLRINKRHIWIMAVSSPTGNEWITHREKNGGWQYHTPNECRSYVAPGCGAVVSQVWRG